jgi:hypothetical protein
MDHSQYGSRIVYPQMPEPLTESDLSGLFAVSGQEDHWARTLGSERALTGGFADASESIPTCRAVFADCGSPGGGDVLRRRAKLHRHIDVFPLVCWTWLAADRRPADGARRVFLGECSDGPERS